MKVPVARERVQLEGRSGVFLVLGVERELKQAYVVDISRDSGYAETVTFEVIRPDTSEAMPEAG